MPETMNYLQFKTVKGNRDINDSHVKRLAESINKNGYLGYPILVSTNMEILDGQHRFMALKSLEKPIPFEIRSSMDIKDIQALNAVSRTWGIMDYIKSYSELGKEDYQKFLRLYEEHKDYLKPSSLCYMTEKSMSAHDLKTNKPHTGVATKAIRSGKYVFYNPSLVDKMVNLKEDFKLLTNKYGDVCFVTAISWVIRHVDIDFDKFLILCIQNRNLLEHGFPASGLYLQEFQKIWNKGRMTKNHVNFFEKTKDDCVHENLIIDSNGN